MSGRVYRQGLQSLGQDKPHHRHWPKQRVHVLPMKNSNRPSESHKFLRYLEVYAKQTFPTLSKKKKFIKYPVLFWGRVLTRGNLWLVGMGILKQVTSFLDPLPSSQWCSRIVVRKLAQSKHSRPALAYCLSTSQSRLSQQEKHSDEELPQLPPCILRP